MRFRELSPTESIASDGPTGNRCDDVVGNFSVEVHSAIGFLPFLR